MQPLPRIALAGIFVACAALLGFGLYLQHVVGLEPCPMCILQRVAFVAVGVVALAAAIHGPKPTGARVYSGFVVLFALAGAAVAARHSWLQRNPPPIASCGAELEFLLDNFPLAQALPKIFGGTGECSKVSWKFLGISIPEWALLWFIAFAAIAVWASLRKAK